jgi:hypothetical protein
VKFQDSICKTNFFLSTLPFNPWAVFDTWLSKIQEKYNLKPVFNKTSPRAHTELELDVLGVPEKLVKYVVTRLKEKIEKKIFFFTQGAQIAIDQFLVSRNFRG